MEKFNAADVTQNAAKERGLTTASTAIPQASSILTPEVAFVCMRQRPGVGEEEKKHRRLGIPGQRKLNRCWRAESQNRWPQSKEYNAQYILRRLHGFIFPWDCSSTPPITYLLTEAISMPSNFDPLAFCQERLNSWLPETNSLRQAISLCQLKLRLLHGLGWQWIAAIEND